MSDKSRLTVVSAAAGTGKTTRLVKEYLSLLREGIPPSRIIAITFTRKAAAELVEAVSRCLRTALKEPVPSRFQNEFKECYEGLVPQDLDFVRKALNELPNAPAGTIDSFILTLLSEFALEARLPVADGGDAAWLDLPFVPGDSSGTMQQAIREVVDPADGNVPEEAKTLLEYLSMQELLNRVTKTLLALPLRDPTGKLQLADGQSLVNELLHDVAKAFKAFYQINPNVTATSITANKPFEIAVKDWIKYGMPDPAPLELICWCDATFDNSTAAPVREMKAYFRGLTRDLGVTTVSLLDLVGIMRHGFTWGNINKADTLRLALASLTEKACTHAFRQAAMNGTLDYNLLTEAAIDLCSRPDRSQRLRDRFDALLVDEVQDSSPRQFRLYEALERLPGANTGDEKRLRSFYVGDSRQSIYLFRGAEPAGLDDLVKLAGSGNNTSEDLPINYRSTSAMVMAQKVLFERTREGIEKLPGLKGVKTIKDVVPDTKHPKRELPQDSPYPEPVAMVTLGERTDGKGGKWSKPDYSNAAIDVFAERLQHAWEKEGRPQDTAAVLTPTWRKARQARDRLRAILKPFGGDAFLDGNRDLTNGQVSKDVRTLVGALWDEGNDIAWAALWRTPMIGLSDGALAAIRDGAGLLPEGTRSWGFSGVLAADGLSSEVYTGADLAVFNRVRPALALARDSIGRKPTADVLERLAASLHWREILLAGPDGMDAVGELEVILDWIRQTESDQVDPDAVLALLNPDEKAEAPRVELQRGQKTVSCMTVLQAKGLKFDHVFVYDIGTSANSGSDWQEWGRGRIRKNDTKLTLLGVKFDPAGALAPLHDPVGILADKINTARADEECLRLAYVAVTRAVRSVTFGLHTSADQLHPALADLWTAGEPMPGVALVTKDAPDTIDDLKRGHVIANHEFPVSPLEPAGWKSVSPSRAAEAWDGAGEDASKKLAADIAARCKFRAGGDRCDPPPVDGETPEHKVTSDAWGTMVHAWMEKGGLKAGADQAAAEVFLRETYGLADNAALAKWLVDLVTRLEETQPDLIRTLRSDEVRLHFEMPFAGVDVPFAGEKWFHAGRMDLLVEFPARKAFWVIDFKAGQKSPTSMDDLIPGASLAEYGPQLEAYRRSLTSAGHKIEKVALLFMRTGAWVAW